MLVAAVWEIKLRALCVSVLSTEVHLQPFPELSLGGLSHRFLNFLRRADETNPKNNSSYQRENYHPIFTPAASHGMTFLSTARLSCRGEADQARVDPGSGALVYRIAFLRRLHP